jgi:hypothetical protein
MIKTVRKDFSSIHCIANTLQANDIAIDTPGGGDFRLDKEKDQKRKPETDTEFANEFSNSVNMDPAVNHVMNAIQQMYSQSGELIEKEEEKD